MCVETMDTSSNQLKTSLVRRNNKPQSKMRWQLVRVAASEEDQALKHRRAAAMKTPISNHLHRGQERAELGKLVKSFRQITKKERRNAKLAAAGMHSHPVGAMAPENTTQYLMGEVYEGLTALNTQTVEESNARLYRDCLSPVSVYAELDSCYESCLAFQTQDFEEMFGQYW